MTIEENSTRGRAASIDREGGVQRPHDALGKRVLSSIVLAPTALAATYFGGPLFAGLVAFAAMVMCFEWVRMIEGEALTPAFYALAAGGAAALIAGSGGWFPVAYGFCVAAGLAAFAAAQRRSRRSRWASFGALYFLAPCVALIWLREHVDNGRALTFLLFVIVWVADCGGYFAGRAIGGPKVSPALSPAKTWAGVFGGALAGAAAGVAGGLWIFGEGEYGVFAMMGGALGVASILGDMTESAFKRTFGVKDTSQFIPGHGGVLDRLDGMIFATTAMTCVLYAHMVIAGFQG